ncbi:MAG: HIT domain-containing protein [Anaerolineaceae bacterium]|jgi:ATP adenylyltransferase|nr:HIT domain-containing protein [Anaerolineaceae bacterium]MDD4043105.1 HIT domain-containing protein [Anaerolineaceae bacterium]MDD4576981.1 HIT domain-containing protein [Anaerolineaceae bacterium]
MDHIYSDRNEYFNRDRGGPCAFCEALSKPDNFNNLIVHRGEYNFVILNLYPYTSGHIMVVPYEHTNRFEGLTSEQLSEMMFLIQKGIRVLIRLYCPQGFNVGLNLGDAGGAGIKEHLHWHIIPRWVGDANFITVIGRTRVLPESLEKSYDKILEAWKQDY